MSVHFRRPARTASLLATLVTLAILAGCGQAPVRTSFETLTNETSKRASDLFTYSTFVSLSGLVPQNGAQLSFYQPDFYDLQGNSPSYAIGLSPTRSFITERKFAMTDTDQATNKAQTVYNIRSGLENARLLATQLATVTTRDEAAQALKDTVGTGIADANQAAQIKALLGADALAADGSIDQERAQAALDHLAQQQTDLKGQLVAALQDARKLAASNNVVITRWNRDRRGNLGAALSEVFAFTEQSHESKSGLLVFGDLRVVTLHSGEDLVDMLRSAPRRFFSFANNAGITTFSIQARHMAYSADIDLQQAVAGQLRLTQDQLAQLSATYKSLNLDASAGFGIAMDISNSALVTNSQVRTETRCFFPPALYAAAIRREIADANGYQDLYVVRAQIKDSLLAAAIRARTDMSDIARRCSSGSGAGAELDPSANAACHQDFADWLATCTDPVSGPQPMRLTAPNNGTGSDIAPIDRLFHRQPYILGTPADH